MVMKYIPKSDRKEVMTDLFYKDSALAKQRDLSDFDAKLEELEETHKDVEGFQRVMAVSLQKIKNQALHPLAKIPSADMTNNMTESLNALHRLKMGYQTATLPELLNMLEKWTDEQQDEFERLLYHEVCFYLDYTVFELTICLFLGELPPQQEEYSPYQAVLSRGVGGNE